jgi:hypothetical protein
MRSVWQPLYRPRWRTAKRTVFLLNLLSCKRPEGFGTLEAWHGTAWGANLCTPDVSSRPSRAQKNATNASRFALGVSLASRLCRNLVGVHQVTDQISHLVPAQRSQQSVWHRRKIRFFHLVNLRECDCLLRCLRLQN